MAMLIEERRQALVAAEREASVLLRKAFDKATEGSEKIATASPGSADRNPTLGLKKLAAIVVPVPSIKKQRWFDRMQAKVQALRNAHAETTRELDTLIPAMLHEVFGREAGCLAA